MSSKSKLSSKITEQCRYPALGEVEEFLYTISDNLEDRYNLDVDIRPEYSTIDSFYNGTWSEVSEEYTADSDGRRASFQVSVRDYYENPDIPPAIEEKVPNQDDTREIRLEQTDGDSTLFDLIADELYEEVKDTQMHYNREGSERIHQFER